MNTKVQPKPFPASYNPLPPLLFAIETFFLPKLQNEFADFPLKLFPFISFAYNASQPDADYGTVSEKRKDTSAFFIPLDFHGSLATSRMNK